MPQIIDFKLGPWLYRKYFSLMGHMYKAYLEREGWEILMMIQCISSTNTMAVTNWEDFEEAGRCGCISCHLVKLKQCRLLKFNLKGDQNASSFVSGRCRCNVKLLISKLNQGKISWVFPVKLQLWWMPQDLIYDQSTLVQVMAWYHQATDHYLNQCWPRSMLPYGITGPHWFNIIYTFSEPGNNCFM